MVLNITVIVWLFVVIILLLSLPRGQWFLAAGSLALQGTFGNVWRHFCLSQVGKCKGDRELLVSSGLRPGMRRDTLQRPGQSPSTGSCPTPNVSSARFEKSHTGHEAPKVSDCV